MGYLNYIKDKLRNDNFGRFSLNSPVFIKEIFNSNSIGLCAGFSMLWIICMLNSYAKKNVNPLNKKLNFKLKNLNNLINQNPNFKKSLFETVSIEWFYNTINELKRDLNDNKEDFVNLVMSLYNDINSRKIFLSLGLFSVSNMAPFYDKLRQAFNSGQNTKSVCVLLNTLTHSMALFFQYDINTGYYIINFYDPNNESGHQTFSLHTSKFNYHNIAIKLKSYLLDNNSNYSEKNNYFTFEIFYIDEIFFQYKLFNDNEFVRNYMSLNPTSSDFEFSFILINACKYNDYYLLRLLLKNKKNKIISINDYYPLHIAITNKYNQIALELLKHNSIDPNKMCRGITPLFSAILSCNTEMAKLLLKNQFIDPNNYCSLNSEKTDSLFLTPLHLATILQNQRIVQELLLHQKIDCTLKFQNKTAHEIAKENNLTDIIGVFTKINSKKSSQLHINKTSELYCKSL